MLAIKLFRELHSHASYSTAHFLRVFTVRPVMDRAHRSSPFDKMQEEKLLEHSVRNKASLENLTCSQSLSSTYEQFQLTNFEHQSPSWEADIPQLVKKFPAFNGTRKFISVFTKAHHWSPSWDRWMQVTSSHRLIKIQLILYYPPTYA